MRDIQPGDVVVCINARFITIDDGQIHPICFCADGLKKGAVYRVVALGTDLHFHTGEPTLLLKDDGWRLARRFRKIRPADEQFTRHIRALEPIREDA